MGIEAETEIKEQARNTLFKVTPKNKDESLETIKNALHTYLNAPGASDFDIITNRSNDISILQWKSNVLHLKSQLTLASAIISAKDETIDALKLANYQLSKNNKAAQKHKKKEEEIIKGVVSVTEFKTKGLSINLPEIVRKLKRKFK